MIYLFFLWNLMGLVGQYTDLAVFFIMNLVGLVGQYNDLVVFL